MKKLLTLLALIISYQLSSQSYLITNKGDSIVGKIQILENLDGNEFIQVKRDKEKVSFDFPEVTRVSKNGDIFLPIVVKNKYRFGRVEIEGYITKMSYKSIQGSQQVQKEILKRSDGNQILVPGAFRFKEIIAEFTKACPSISEAVSEKEYKRKELDKIIKDFNVCMASSSAQVLSVSNIERFKSLLRQSSVVKNKDQALEMFQDIVDKLADQKDIPNYLNNGFKALINEDETLLKRYAELIGQ